MSEAAYILSLEERVKNLETKVTDLENLAAYLMRKAADNDDG